MPPNPRSNKWGTAEPALGGAGPAYPHWHPSERRLSRRVARAVTRKPAMVCLAAMLLGANAVLWFKYLPGLMAAPAKTASALPSKSAVAPVKAPAEAPGGSAPMPNVYRPGRSL